MGYTLGISAFYHDSAACLLINDQIIAAAQEERFTRKKHDSSFPAHSIKFCLDRAKVDLSEIEEIVFYDKPFVKFERVLESFYAVAPFGIKAFVKHIPEWIKEKIFFKKLIKDELNALDLGKFKQAKFLFSEHHLSHAAWAYFTSAYTESAILTIDGVGEWTTSAIFKANGTEITAVKEQHFPHSVGLLYSSFTQFLGFKVNDGEYKMMGLAPYGNRKTEAYQNFKSKIEKELVKVYGDGSIQLNLHYFEFLKGERMITSEKWKDLFGIGQRNENETLESIHCDFALAAQDVTEEIILKLALEAKKVSGSKNLCLSGGVAYNCVANGLLIKEKIFDSVHVPPAVGDSGSAIGAAFSSYYLAHPEAEKRTIEAKNEISFLGPEFTDQQIEGFLESRKIPYTKSENQDALCEATSEILSNGAVIGWMQGRMEFGARALGARSILANPKTPDIQKTVNQKIKFRESFRPFAPVLLEEDLSQYFDLNTPSPYMALVAPILDEFRIPLTEDFEQKSMMDKSRLEKSAFPGITHVDYSSRIQTVDSKTNPLLHKLLSTFKQQTGHSLLINTSFNVKDEPIVCSLNDAYNCFMKTHMDYLVLGSFILNKSECQ